MRFLVQNKKLILVFLLMAFTAQKIGRMEFPIRDFSDTALSMASVKNVDMRTAVLLYAFYMGPLCMLFAYVYHISVVRARVGQAARAWLDGLRARRVFTFLLCVAMLCLGCGSWAARGILFGLLLLVYRYQEDADAGSKAAAAFLMTALSLAPPLLFFLTPNALAHGFTLLCLLVAALYSQKALVLREALWRVLFSCCAAGTAYLFILGLSELWLACGHSIKMFVLFLPYLAAFFYGCYWYRTGRKADLAKDEKRAVWSAVLLLIFYHFPVVLGQSWYIDFFEGANHGLSISGAILWKQIPLLENLDAHLLSQTAGGLLYYAFSKDYVGAVVGAPYAPFLSAALGLSGLFCLLRRFFDGRASFLLLTVFPWSWAAAAAPGLASAIVFIEWRRRGGLFSDAALVVSFIALCIYRIDLGASFGGALALCAVLYLAIHKAYGRLCRLLVLGVLAAAGCFALAYLASEARGVSVLAATQAFFTAFLSNQHWSYGSLGRNGAQVLFVYFICPAVLAIWMRDHIARLLRGEETEQRWLLCFLYAGLFFSVPRMMARHTLIEHATGTYALMILLLGLYLADSVRGYRALYFAAGLSVLVALFGVGKERIWPEAAGRVHAAADAVRRQSRGWFIVKQEDEAQISLLKAFFDERLRPDETYFDFTDQSLFFAFTGRKNPIYINQSPAMIAGKRGQRQTIDDLERRVPRFVMMPYRQHPARPYGCYEEIDGIWNLDRYYLLTEYVAARYRPYCQVGHFAVWCRKEEYASWLQYDQAHGRTAAYLDYTYGEPRTHRHCLGAIPFVWGAYGSSEDMDGARTALVREGEAWRLDEGEAKACRGGRGFLRVELEAAFDGTAELLVTGDGIADITYQFDVKRGRHAYLFRVSSDLLWYTEALRVLEVRTGSAKALGVWFQRAGNSDGI